MTGFTTSTMHSRAKNASAERDFWLARFGSADQVGLEYARASIEVWGTPVLYASRGMLGSERTLQLNSGMFSAPVETGNPSLHADSPRELLETVRRKAEEKGRRSADQEIRRLRKEMAMLEREVALLRQGTPRHHLVQTVFVHGLEVPAGQNDLIAAIQDSRRLLELGDNWDGDGAAGYTEETWARAAKTLIDLVMCSAGGETVAGADFEILPGSHGGIDIDVRVGNRELLISVPADPQKQSRFYGDDGQGGDQIKATFGSSRFPRWVSCWLAG